MLHAAGRLVARLAVELHRRLHGRGDRIERRPMPRAGGAEYADRRGAERGRDVQQPRVVRHCDVGRRQRQDRAAQVSAGQIAGERAGIRDDLRRERLLVRSAEDPDGDALCGQAPRHIRVGGPAFRRPDRAGRQRDRRSARGKAEPLAPSGDLGRRDPQLGQRPVGRLGRAGGQRQSGALVDHAWALALAEAQVVEEEETHLPEPSDPLRNARQERRQRSLPGARHDQRGAVVLALQPLRQRRVLIVGEPPARQVDHDRLAQFGHVVGQRGAQCRREHVHRARGKSRFQQLHDAVAAHEVADPHVRHEQNRTTVRRSSFLRTI